MNIDKTIEAIEELEDGDVGVMESEYDERWAGNTVETFVVGKFNSKFSAADLNELVRQRNALLSLVKESKDVVDGLDYDQEYESAIRFGNKAEWLIRDCEGKEAAPSRSF